MVVCEFLEGFIPFLEPSHLYGRCYLRGKVVAHLVVYLVAHQRLLVHQMNVQMMCQVAYHLVVQAVIDQGLPTRNLKNMSLSSDSVTLIEKRTCTLA